MVTISSPTGPRKYANDACVNSMPCRPLAYCPLMTIVKPVIEQTMSVSINTCVIETSACRPGKSVFAAAAAIGAEPSPASFENTPRATPYRIAAPSAPPPIASALNVLAKMVANADGINSKFMTRMVRPPPT